MSRDGAGLSPLGVADLMRRAFDIDVLACPRCDGRLRLIATVEDPDAISAIMAAVSGRTGGSSAAARAGAEHQPRLGERRLSSHTGHRLR